MKKTWIMLAAVFTMVLLWVPSAFAGETIAIQSSASSSGQSTSKALPKGMTPRTDVPDAVTPVIEVDNDTARLMIRYKASDNKAYKVIVTASDGTYEYYDLYAVNADEYFPLNKGNGAYQVLIARDLGGGKAQAVTRANVTLKAKDQNAAYLSSSYYVNWEGATDTQKYVNQLTGGKQAKSDSTSAVAKPVWQNVVSIMSYDHDAYKNLPSGYLPDIDSVLKKKKGVCFDISTMLAAMLRYSDVPTRLVMGTSKETKGDYHAWNEVYLDGKWVVVDATYDATYDKGNHKYEMVKNAKDFTAMKVF